MSLPKHVQEGLDKANAIQSKIAGQQPTPAQDPAPADTAATQEAAKPTPIVDPVVKPTPAPAPADDATWEQRYKSFKGHADAELKRAHEAVESMRNDNADLKATLKQMQEQMDKLANPPEPTPEPPKGATEEDIESFGTDMVGFVQRVTAKAAADAMLAVEAKVNGVMSAIDEMRGQVTQVDERATVSAEALFFKDLADKVPDYLDINDTIEWKEWLQGVDMMSGATRQQLLAQAQSQLAVDRVAAIFNNFKRESGIGDASATSSQQQNQANDLESQVSPPRSKSTQAGGQQPEGQKKIWTQAEISGVYNRQARGKIAAEEFKALELEINQAVREGRVR
jgi:hypothetical protein